MSRETFESTKVYFPAIVRILFTLVLVSVAILLALSEKFSWGTGAPLAAWIVFIVVAAVLVLLSYSWHAVAVNESQISIRWFPFFSKNINLIEVHSAVPTTTKFISHGLGLRLLGGGWLGLINRPGPSVDIKIMKRSGYRISFNSTKERDRVLRIIEMNIEKCSKGE